MKNIQKEYQALFEYAKRVHTLESVQHLLEWDQETYLPKAAFSFRSEQIEEMAGICHKEKTSSKWRRLLEKLIDLKSGKTVSGLSEKQNVALREWRREYLLGSALPVSFVKKASKLASESISIWAKAKQENDFALFAPFLEKTVETAREKAELLGYTTHPYDALLDYHEPEMTTKEISSLFKKIESSLSPLLQKIREKPVIRDDFLYGSFPKEKILHVCQLLLQTMGYDFEKGRLDLSNHPFSSSLHPYDSRITTRIHNNSLFDPLSATLHEGGHGLYEMGMDAKDFGSPLCEAISLGMHESQSRIWETFLGQSKPFWKFFFPSLQSYFPSLEPISLENFYRAVNKVKPSFIRVEADEVHYCLHIILRFEIEKKLIEGSLKVKDLPEIWNAGMKEYFGITPSTNTEGCLQDIHWSMGEFGYFPTYALGNLYAAQLFSQFEKEWPDWEKRVAEGELLFFRNWLKENVHQFGKQYRAKKLMIKITGEPLSEIPYLTYLKDKYADIYKF